MDKVLDITDWYMDLSFWQKLGITAAVYIGGVVASAFLASLDSELKGEQETIKKLESEAERLKRETLSSAEEYQKKTTELINFIRRKRYNLFYPTILEEINRDMDKVQEANRNNEAELYLKAAQEAYDTAFEGAKVVIKGEMAWHRGQEGWLNLCKDAGVLQQASQGMELELSNGDKVQFQASDWCDMEQMERLSAVFESRIFPDTMTLAEIDSKLQEGRSVKEQMETLLGQGNERCLDAYDREKKCGKLFQFMVGCGWVLESCSYEEGDAKKMLLLTMKNSLGDKVRFELPPMEHIGMKLRVARYNPADNERITQELALRLQENGFLFRSIETENRI